MSEIPLDEICPGCGDLIEPGSGLCAPCANETVTRLTRERDEARARIAHMEAVVEAAPHLLAEFDGSGDVLCPCCGLTDGAHMPGSACGNMACALDEEEGSP